MNDTASRRPLVLVRVHTVPDCAGWPTLVVSAQAWYTRPLTTLRTLVEQLQAVGLSQLVLPAGHALDELAEAVANDPDEAVLAAPEQPSTVGDIQFGVRSVGDCLNFLQAHDDVSMAVSVLPTLVREQPGRARYDRPCASLGLLTRMAGLN